MFKVDFQGDYILCYTLFLLKITLLVTWDEEELVSQQARINDQPAEEVWVIVSVTLVIFGVLIAIPLHLVTI
jgi:uncharacterized membrane protein YidH (DUF202 family)